MGKSSIRVLVVENFEPFRRVVCSTLEERPDVQIVAEVADGMTAVQMLHELKPDLVVLDIGLAGLNGIEAARQISSISPSTKILFVSQEMSPEVVQEALGTGAQGYVKTDAGKELLTAVDSVLRGGTFISRRLSGRPHDAFFYSNDARFLERITDFVDTALKAGKAAIIIVTKPRRDHLLQLWGERRPNLGTAINERKCIIWDADEVLSQFMLNDLPDQTRFLKTTSDLIAESANVVNGEHARIAIVGECASLLWTQGRANAAIRLESLWDDISEAHRIEVLCGYSLVSFQGGTKSLTFDRICGQHSVIHSV